MNITDEMLSAAAPEAAERWLSTLPGREDCGHDFSLTFEASMAALLQRRRRRWKTLALLAAVIGVLAALLASGAVASRPDDYRVYAAQEEGFVAYRALPKEDGSAQPLHHLTLGWVPESFSQTHASVQEDCADIRYSHQTESRGFSLSQWHRREISGTLMGNYQMETVQVDGNDAIFFYTPEKSITCLLWTQGTDAFVLYANNLEQDDLFRIAENLKW